MAKMKMRELEEVFKQAGLDESTFNNFKKRLKVLKKRLKDIGDEIEQTIDSVPDASQKQKLRDLVKAFDKAEKLGVFDK